MNRKIVKTLTAATVISMLLSNSVIFADSTKSQNEMRLEHNVKSYVNKDGRHNKHNKFHRDEDEVIGTIIKIYGNKIEVKDKKGKVHTFKAGNKTEIEYGKDDDKNLTFKDLKVGMLVEVEFDDDCKNQHHIDAEEITILKENSDDEDNGNNEVVDSIIISSAKVEKANDNNILINNNGTKIQLNLNKDTKYFNQFGKKINPSDIKEGMVVKIEHSAMMTRSIPAQTSAISISIVKEQEENMKVEKQVVSVNKDTKTVIIGDKENPTEQLVLKINNDTKLLDQYNRVIKLENIKEGMTVSVEHSKSMTRSIPAQTNAVSVQIVKSIEDSILLTAEVIDVQKDRILVGEKDNDTTNKYLMIGNDTVLTDNNGKVIKISDIKPGMNITAEHSKAMTMSLPPQTQAFVVKVNGLN